MASLGDSNTRYFHAVSKTTSAKNRFSLIADKDRLHVYEEEEISKVISGYTQTSSNQQASTGSKQLRKHFNHVSQRVKING